MCDPVTLMMGAGTLFSAFNGMKQASTAEKANEQAQQNAQQAKTDSERAQNKADQKSPNVGAMLEANTGSARSTGAGTMLTGPQGIDPDTLMLGKNTLLGV
jgi:hypothetical protein